MKHSVALTIAQQHNQEGHEYTVGVLQLFATMAGIPVTIGIFRIKEGDPNRHFTDIEDAAEYGEKIVRKMLTKT